MMPLMKVTRRLISKLSAAVETFSEARFAWEVQPVRIAVNSRAALRALRVVVFLAMSFSLFVLTIRGDNGKYQEDNGDGLESVNEVC